MTATEALRALTGDPDYFLKYYPLHLAGSPEIAHGGGIIAHRGAVNILPCHIVRTGYEVRRAEVHLGGLRIPNTISGLFNNEGVPGHRGGERPGRILPFVTHKITTFRIATAGAPAGSGGENIDAHIVPVVSFDTLTPPVESNLPSFKLDNRGDGIMLTGQLTGCTFCWAASGVGEVLCAHMQPSSAGADLVRPPETPAQVAERAGLLPLARQVLNAKTIQDAIRGANGQFAGEPGTRGRVQTFGRRQYEAGTASIIGVRSSGVWAFYGQVFSGVGYARKVICTYKYDLAGNETRL